MNSRIFFMSSAFSSSGMLAAMTEPRIGVSMLPGAMQFTRIPYSPTSTAAHLVKKITPTLDV